MDHCFVTTDCIITDSSITKIVLIQRKNDPDKGKWALPGGFVEKDETVEQCVVREIMEETGLHIKNPKLVGVYSNPLRDPRGRVITVVFHSVVDKTDGMKAQTDAKDCKWMELKQLPDLAFDHNEMITDFKRFVV
ncbi:MAG: NUDIX hydrolase [Planctomycetes bacterium]|nr:NUDIX hydrolase [Planctomycetota bacterium]